MKTQITQRKWREVAIELRAKLNEWNHSLTVLSKASGVKYDAIYRMHKGGLERRSRPAFELCKFFGINTSNTKSEQSQLKESLHADLDQVWDGSVAHAKLLVKLIRSTKGFGVQEKS
jgi:hypothetical protein